MRGTSSEQTVITQAEADRLRIAELIQLERASRDQADWPSMHDCYDEASTVELLWISSSGSEFVEASKRAFARGSGIYGRAVHRLDHTRARIAGDRALAETGCTIVTCNDLAGIGIGLTSQTRLRWRLIRGPAGWRIAGLRAIYFWDGISPLIPGEKVEFDRERLASYRVSYRWMSYISAEKGRSVSPVMPGIDRPDLVEACLRREQHWLEDRPPQGPPSGSRESDEALPIRR
jgi:hypothetical protein